jgi:hypothetical protein
MSHSSPQTIPAEPWQEPTSAYPPRFWWLTRGAIVFVITLLALAGLRWWWGKIADDRLAAMIAEAHARGEPILPEDFNPAPIPDSQNAAMTLRLAADSIVRDVTYHAFENTWMGGPLTPSDLRQLDHMISINSKPLQLCRAARSQAGLDWNIQITQPTIMVLPPPYLYSQGRLVELLKYAALRDHTIGNEAEAIEFVRDMLRQASALDQGYPCIINHLVAIGCNAVATTSLELITPNVRIGGDRPSTAALHPASRAEVRSLIDDLLNEGAFKQSAIRSWQGERMSALDMAIYNSNGGNLPAWVSVPLNWHKTIRVTIGPMIKLDGSRFAEWHSKVAAAAAQPDWRAATSSLPPERTGDESEIEQGSMLFSSGPAENRLVEMHFRVLTERRAAAIALAVQLYKLDHSAHLPKTLGEFVPQYLPYVPLDPMAADGQPMKYRPDRNPAVVYSVGRDGVDDGGSSIPASIGIFSGDHWHTLDAVYPLELAEPTSQPSTSAQNHE